MRRDTGKKSLLAVLAGAALLGLSQAAHAVIWTSDSGTTIDFNIDGGNAFVDGSNNFVVVPTSTATASVRAGNSVPTLTNTTLFGTVNTAAVTANPSLKPYVTFKYIERAYFNDGTDHWRGQYAFINGQGGGPSNNRFQIGSQFGNDGGGQSALFFIRKTGPADGTGYINTSGNADMAGFGGTPALPRQVGPIEHTMTVAILDGNGTVEIVMDGQVFNQTNFPGATGMEHNEGELFGLDQLEFIIRNGAYSAGFNNEFLFTDLIIGTGYGDPVPEPASLALLAAGGLLTLARRRRA
jgi:hypothetical protein